MNRMKLAILATTGLVSCEMLMSVPTPAYAATTTPTGAIEEVVVTAQKRTENIQKVPIAITALTSKTLASRGVVNLTDLSRQVPGASFGDIAGAPQIFVRGVGFNTLSGAGESAIAVNIDGVYIEHPGAIGTVQYDLGEVEVLRGPQGTLYGHNAIGGAVNMNSATPSSVFRVGGTVSYGNYAATRESAYVTGPISDNVRVRLFVENDHRNGYITNLAPPGVGSKTYDGLRGTFGRLSVDANITANTTLKIRAFDRFEGFTGPIYKPSNPTFLSEAFGIPTAFLDTVTSFNPYQAKINTKADGVRNFSGGSARVDSDFGAFKFVSLTAFNAYDLNEKIEDGEGTLLPIFEIKSRKDFAQTFSQEFDVLFGGPRTQVTMGAYYMHDLDNFSALVPGPFNYQNVSYDKSRQVFDTGSIFADVTEKITNAWNVYGGLRVLAERTRFTHTDFAGLLTSLNGAVPPFVPGDTGTEAMNLYACTQDGQGNDGLFDPQAAANGKQSNTRATATGRIGTSYQINDQSNVYVQYAQGDKSRVFDNSSCTKPAKPERLYSYEVGTKNRFFGGKVQLDAAGYYYDYKGLQVESIDFPSILYQNADAEVYGAEADAKWAPTRQLSFDLAVNLMHATYTRFTSSDFLNLIVPGYDTNTNQDGHYLNRSPKYTITFSPEYDLPVGLGTVAFNSTVFASGSYFLRAYNLAADRQGAYVSVDGSVGFTPNSGHWMLRGYIKNATNHAYVLGEVASLPGQESIYGAPRTYGVELSASF